MSTDGDLRGKIRFVASRIWLYQQYKDWIVLGVRFPVAVRTAVDTWEGHNA